MFEETTYCAAARQINNRNWDHGIYSCNVCICGSRKYCKYCAGPSLRPVYADKCFYSAKPGPTLL